MDLSSFVIHQSKKHASERGELIEFFTNKLNEDRDGIKFKKLTIRGVAVKLGHLDLNDLYYLKSYCLQAKNFSSCFWWSLKAK